MVFNTVYSGDGVRVVSSVATGALVNLACEAARAGALAIKSEYKKIVDFSIKTDGSPVSEADLASNKAIISVLKTSDIAVISEELPPAKTEPNEPFWLVDPLDGTKEFLAKNGEFCVCIALIKNGAPVLGAIAYIDDGTLPSSFFTNSVATLNQTKLISGNSSHNERVEAFAREFDLKIIRRGSALKFLSLASGEAGVYLRLEGSSLWDIAAGDAILRASGGVAISLNTLKPLVYEPNKSLRCDHFLALSASEMKNKNRYLEFINRNLQDI